MKRKLITVFTLFLGISSILCGCDKTYDTNNKNNENNDTNISSSNGTTEQNEGLKTGVYYIDANVMKPCIVLTEDKMIFFTEKNILTGKIYDYTKNQDTIIAKNSYSEIQVAINDDTLTYENNTYTFKHADNWFPENYSVSENIIDPYVYYYAITDEDFNSASKIATEYYNNLMFVQDIISIELDDNVESYSSAAYVSETIVSSPGNIILLKVITSTKDADGYIFDDHRYITLTRISADSAWSVVNEGR